MRFNRARRLMAAAIVPIAVAACDQAPVIAPPEAVESVDRPALRRAPTFLAMYEPGGALPIAVHANGDNVHQITGGASQACSINTGIAFDGTDLIMSCWYHNTLDVLNVQTGALIGTVTVPGYSGFGAMAWDRSTGTLWACGNGGQAGFMDRAVKIDVGTGMVLASFPVNGTCTDGLAFDGSDNTLWTSGDVYQTLQHWALDGTLLGNVNIGSNIGPGNSGIAIGGASFFLANNGNSQIYEVDRAFTSYALFASFPRRIEDLECDDVTFAPQFSVIWQQDAYDRIINAFEIPAGACPFGGGGGDDDTGAAIDIKPGDPNNGVSLLANWLAVAILSSSDFDATQVDPETVTLGNDDGNDTRVGRNAQGIRWRIYDADGDGDDDMVVYFRIPALIENGDLDKTTSDLWLNGKLRDGTSFKAADVVRI